jgi:enoyl-CoA hydratase
MTGSTVAEQGAFSTIAYAQDPESKYATITLNNPDKLNVIGYDCLQEIIRVLEAADRDDTVKVIIIKGAGRAFSAGHDLAYWGEQYGMKPGVRPPQRPRAVADRDFFWEAYRRIFYSLKPKIAQVHGYCLEGAVNLTMLCDITIAAESATLGFPGQRAGDAGFTLLPMLFNLIGYKRARELLLTGETISARKAEEIGLINRAVPDDRLEDVVTRMAKAIALMPIDGLVMGEAYSHLTYDRLGFTSGFMYQSYGHAWWSNIKLEPEDFNLFKRRAQVGIRDALHERDARYEGLLDPDMGGLMSDRRSSR